MSDVLAAAAPAEDGRERSRAVAPALREPQHSRGGVLELQGVDLVLHVGDPVSGDRVQDLLRVLRCLLGDGSRVQGRLVAVLGDVGVNLGGVDRAVVIGRVNGPEGVATTLLSYRLFIPYFSWFPMRSDYIFTLSD